MKPKGELLQLVADGNGFDSIDDMLTVATYDFDNRCPGICTACENVVEDCDADAKEGQCVVCGKNHITSVLVLADLI